MMRTRKAILIGVILIVAAIGALRFAGLSRAASHATAGPTDECQMFSCIFDDDSGDDD